MAKGAVKKITGTFCERTQYPAADFDKRSFRWKQSGGAWLLVACPVGKWAASKSRCKAGTRIHKLLTRAKTCPGGKRVTK